MTVFHLKFIAIMAMVIDHAGLFFFPHILAFRIIGRIAFPIFAWLIANGARHTGNKSKYLIRLFLFALISQPFYYLVYLNRNFSYVQLNVIFTLIIGLLAIFIVQNTKNFFLRLVLVMFFAATAQIIKSEYGAVGVMSIVFFYIFYDKKLYMIIAQVIINIIPFLILPFAEDMVFYGFLYQYIMQLISLFALLLIFRHNGKPGLRVKYLFYAIYPIQYVVIYLLQKIV